MTLLMGGAIVISNSHHKSKQEKTIMDTDNENIVSLEAVRRKLAQTDAIESWDIATPRERMLMEIIETLATISLTLLDRIEERDPYEEEEEEE